MAFFDPAYKKLLAMCPTSFQQNEGVWLVLIDDAITKHKAVVSADLFRVAVICHLAIESSEKDPSSWSAAALTKVNRSLHSAHKTLSNTHQRAAFDTANILKHLGN